MRSILPIFILLALSNYTQAGGGGGGGNAACNGDW